MNGPTSAVIDILRLMNQSERFTALAWLCVRVILGLILAFAIAGLLQENPPAPKQAKPWIGPDARSAIPAGIYAPVLGAIALLLAVGWRVSVAVIALSATLIFVAIERHVRNPFTNLTADVAMILALGLTLLAAGPERDRWTLDHLQGRAPTAMSARWSWVTLFVRLFVGTIFFTQRFRNLFLGAGQSRLPSGLCEAVCGNDAGAAPLDRRRKQSICAIRRRAAADRGSLHAFGGGDRRVVLISIIFGHLIEGPFTAPSAMRDFATANVVAMTAVMILASLGNRWSLDALLFGKRDASRPVT